MWTKALSMMLVLVALAAPANAGPKLRIKGKGLDATGSRFAFTVKSQSEGRPPRVELDFGESFAITGELECLDSIEGYVIVSGVIDVPVGALQYFRLYAFDGKPSAPDRVAAELSSAPLDCDIDEDEEDGPPAIQRGNIVVKIPQG
jgi:hypothetical protein